MQPEIRVLSQPAERPTQVNKVLRNTYWLLGLTMVPTVIGASVGVHLNLLPLMTQSPLLSILLPLALMFGLFWGISANRNNGLGVALLLALTFFMGLMLGPILQVALSLKNGVQLVGLAAGGTGVIFFSLAGLATFSKKDFSFMGKFLFIGLILLVLASLANLFFQIPVLALALSAIGVLIFSGFILVDVSRIVHGGETNYVMATLSIYLDIYNLFINLLNILMAVAGQRN